MNILAQWLHDKAKCFDVLDKTSVIVEAECWMRDLILGTESFKTLPSLTCSETDSVSGIIQNFFDHLSLLKILWWVFPWKVWISDVEIKYPFCLLYLKKKPLEDTLLKFPKQQNKYQTINPKTLKGNSCNMLDPHLQWLPLHKLPKSGPSCCHCFHALSLVSQDTIAPSREVAWTPALMPGVRSPHFR